MKSIKGQLNKEELISYVNNTIKFTAPALSIFFAQLALKIDWRVAALVALYALYSNLSDLFKKIGQGGPNGKA